MLVPEGSQLQAGIEDFELRGDTATHVGILDGKGGINIIPIAETQCLECRADLHLATLGNIHPQLVDGNSNVKFNTNGCK